MKLIRRIVFAVCLWVVFSQAVVFVFLNQSLVGDRQQASTNNSDVNEQTFNASADANAIDVEVEMAAAADQSADKLDSVFARLKGERLRAYWSDEYVRAFARAPPTNYARWIAYALKNKCYLHPRHYRQIDEDLRPFRERYRRRRRRRRRHRNESAARESAPITRSMLERAMRLTRLHQRYITVVHVSRRGGLQRSENDSFEAGKWLYIFTRELLDMLPEHRAPIPLVLNVEEPRLLSPDKRCWQRHYAHLRAWHSYVERAARMLANRTFVDVYELRNDSDYRNNNDTADDDEDEDDVDDYWLRPLFSHSKLRCHGDIRIPGPFHVNSLFSRVRPPHTDWSHKRSRLTWRGSTTGGLIRDESYAHFHRMHFVRWAMNTKAAAVSRSSKNYSSVPPALSTNTTIRTVVQMDVAFTRTTHCTPDYCARVRREYLFSSALSARAQQRSKYIAVVDGNVFAARLLGFLHSNSALFVSGLFADWFSAWLRPWVHYVPFRVDLADLGAHLEWARAHDAAARRIGENARALARDHLRLADMRCYTGLLLLEYADLLEPDKSQ